MADLPGTILHDAITERVMSPCVTRSEYRDENGIILNYRVVIPPGPVGDRREGRTQAQALRERKVSGLDHNIEDDN